MLQAKREEIRELLLTGSFGLEKESLRVHGDGTLSHTDHPFAGNRHIVRDFCENQTEINTPVFGSAHEAVEALGRYDREIQRVLRDLPQREYLWPFSNPPYIKNEDDVPVARFTGAEAEKTAYREYLSDRYGRYKMAFSGIHVNYSFGEELLRRSFALSGEADFRAYKDQLYVDLAQRAAAHGWLMVALTAASPVLDSSFVEKGRAGGAYFEGLASVRCSELGYWNFFAPIFDYSSLEAYAQSIQNYVDDGLLRFPTELYYPIRLKPAGKNSLPALREKGVNHIELRMFDLNPFAPHGVDERDVAFAELLLCYLASTPREDFPKRAQVQAVANFKNAAHYDLKTVKIVAPDGEVCTVAHAALALLGRLRAFYRGFGGEIEAILDFEESKFADAENRYAWRLRQEFAENFVEKGLEVARRRQEADCA